MKVAIQGELGSFSHEAAAQMLPRCTVIPCARSADVFDRLQRGSVAAAIIPIENSLAGTVAEHADLLVAHDVFIQAEFLLRIVHNVIAVPGTKLSALRKVFSHPVALDQCRDFFRQHAHIEPVPFYDTAGSVKHVVSNRLPDAAAIASRHAARQYSGKILQASIEDDKRNFTRFFLLRKSTPNTRIAGPCALAMSSLVRWKMKIGFERQNTLTIWPAASGARSISTGAPAAMVEASGFICPISGASTAAAPTAPTAAVAT